MRGNRVKSSMAKKGKRLLSRSILLRLYRSMLLIRKVQLKIEELYKFDEMKTPVHLCLGQEAVAAGVCANLEKNDYVFSNHRGHGHYLAKGGNLKEMIAELYCKETGSSRGRGGSMHLIDTSVGLMGSSSIVAGSIPIAVGAALSFTLRNTKQVAVVFFGDAASEEGVMYESMNFAALKKLPVVFVCENNFYSVCSHQSARQAPCDIALRPKAFCIPSVCVDGADVLAVYAKAKEAVAHARSGKGPFFLECQAYRWRGHSGEGDPCADAYRKAGEHKQWMKRDPVFDFEKYLRKEKIVNDQHVKNVNKSIDEDIKEAFAFAQAAALPEKAGLSKYLYNS